MDPHRRDVLAMLSALVAAGLLPACRGEPGESDTAPEPAPDRPPEPAAWAAPGTHDPEAFGWTPVVSDATPDGALVALHTTEVLVDLVVVAATADDWEEVDRRAGLEPVDGWLQVELTGLAPDRAHRLAFVTADGRRSEVARFRTALDAAGYRKLVIGATSCLGGANPDLDSLARLAEREPDLVLLLGDTVYADGSSSREQYRAHWKRVLGKPSFRAMCQSASVAATWDDHEVDDNWVLGETVSEAQLANAVEAFHEAVPWRREGAIGLWRTLRWGDVLEIFLLDSRGERDWDTRIVSDEQLAWAVAGLRASTATFKIVCCSVHLADHTEMFGPVEESDRWQGYPAQREQLVAACAEVPGVIVVTGDMHYGGLQRLAPAGGLGHEVFEVAAGPGGSTLLPAADIAELGEEDHTIQYPLLVDGWTAAVLTFDPGLGTVVVEFVDDDGAVVGSQTLTLT